MLHAGQPQRGRRLTHRSRVRAVRLGLRQKVRRRRPRPGDKWHLDEMVIRMNGVQHYLRRAVAQRATCGWPSIPQRAHLLHGRGYTGNLPV